MKTCPLLGQLLAVCLLAQLIASGHFLTEAGINFTVGPSTSDLLSSRSQAEARGEVAEIAGEEKLRRVRQKVNHAKCPSIHVSSSSLREQLLMETLPAPVVAAEASGLTPKRKLDIDLNLTPPSSPTHEVATVEQSSSRADENHKTDAHDSWNMREPIPHGLIPSGLTPKRKSGIDLNSMPPSSPTHDVAPIEQSSSRANDNHKIDVDDSWDMRESIPPGFIPMPQLTRWAVVHPNLRTRYQAQFVAQIDPFSYRHDFRTSVKKSEKIDHLPIYMFPYLNTGSEIPHKVFLPKIAQLEKSDTSAADKEMHNKPAKVQFETPSVLGLRLGTLIKCILFSHGAFLSRIGCTIEEELMRHDSLMEWLHKLVFYNKDRLPICGQISEIDYERVKEKGYNPAQKLLIRYLQGPAEDEIFHTDFVALALIGIWYKQELPTEWAERFLKSEKVFWLRMQESINVKQGSKGWRAGHWMENRIEGQHEGEVRLGNFDLIKLRQALGFVSGRSRSWVKYTQWEISKDDFKPSTVEERIIKAQQMTLSLVDGLAIRVKLIKSVEKTQAGLQSARLKNTGKEVFLVRVVALSGRIYPHRSLERRVTNLLRGTREYHHLLIDRLGLRGIPSIPDAHDRFLVWFDETILTPSGANSLPLFGYVAEVGEKLDESRFNPIQHLVLLFITKHKKEHFATDVLSILGYWYKNLHPVYWNDHFKDESHFAQFVTSPILHNGKEDQRVLQQLPRADREGNPLKSS
ncbi:hypothetical protein H4Q26_006494 [Puccinia striiformis f. sp. tritici PST-130]|nr:hypothetical protein H4Q26_006494 [Puccinia striiformis f. sp. tritici PST-130]